MEAKTQYKTRKRERRHGRVRAKVHGTQDRPRLAVFKSNKYVYAQLIDDVQGVTLAQSNSLGMKEGSMKDKAMHVGKDIAEKAQKSGVSQVVFDRGGFLFTGTVKALADGAREGGLTF